MVHSVRIKEMSENYLTNSFINDSVKMRLSPLWIFSILLTTGEAILMCGFRDYRSCDHYSNDSEEAYRCLKTLKPSYKRCNVSYTLCTSTQFTFSDNSTFKQQGCVSEERACKFTEEMQYKISILTNRNIANDNVNCTSCKVSGCNSIQELGDNFGCYVVNETGCINDFNNAVMSQPIDMAQHQTLACLIDTSPVMCGNKENLCRSKTFTFDKGERLVVKNCVPVRNKTCMMNEEKFTMQNIIGKNVVSLECDYCQTDFCNNQTVFVKPAIRCYYSNFEKCNQTKRDGNTQKQQNDTYNCIKRVKPTLRNCQEGCRTMLLTVEDNVTLAMHMCLKPNMTCQLKNGGTEFGFNIGKKIMNHFCRNCTKDWCNNETTILPPVPKPLTCYHSDLDNCMSIVRVITDFDAVLRCLTVEMNRNIRTRTCDLGLKCTTIVFTMESYGKVVKFATCGSGPKSKCEKDAYETHFDRFVGQPIKHIECKYCETDYCNNVTVSLEGSIRPLSSKRDVPCQVNQIFTCEHSPLKGANEERKFLQEKVFKCLKDSSLATDKCQICLTVKYKFHHKEELVLKMCGDNDVRNDFDISGSRKCDLKKNQKWFKEFTGKKLISIKCNPCDTDYCNEKKASKKSLEVPNEAIRKLMPNVVVIVFTTLFLF